MPRRSFSLWLRTNMLLVTHVVPLYTTGHINKCCNFSIVRSNGTTVKRNKPFEDGKKCTKVEKNFFMTSIIKRKLFLYLTNFHCRQSISLKHTVRFQTRFSLKTCNNAPEIYFLGKLTKRKSVKYYCNDGRLRVKPTVEEVYYQNNISCFFRK